MPIVSPLWPCRSAQYPASLPAVIISGPAVATGAPSMDRVNETGPSVSQVSPSAVTVVVLPSNLICSGSPETGLLASIRTSQAGGTAGLPHLSSALMPRKNGSPTRRWVAVTPFHNAGGPGMIGT